MDALRYFDFTGKKIEIGHQRDRQITRDGYGPHTHDGWEMIHIKAGRLTYQSEGRSYTVESGSCILTPPGVYHTLRFLDKTVYDRYVMQLNSPLFDVLSDLPEVVDISNNQLVLDLFQKMDFYATYLDGALLDEALVRLAEEALLNFKINSNQHPKNYIDNPIITQAILYINEHLQEVISLDALCAHLHITKSYLHRLFLDHLQLSPGRYITGKRLEQARMDIRSGIKPAKVYSLWGFQDYCTFYRNYVRHFGYPPSQEQDKPAKKKIEW